MRLVGKTLLVTGAGSGLGTAAAMAMAAEGGAVACADRDEAGAREVAERITAAGGRAVGFAADVASAASCEDMVARTESELGPIDVLMANAGITGPGSAVEVSEELWDRVIDIDLKGVWLSCRAVLPGMIERGRGSIINTASIGGIVGVGRILPYAAAKGGVIAMTKQMAFDFGPDNIRINAICPGSVFTPLVEETYRARAEGADDPEQAYQDALVAMTAKYPLGRFGQPKDIGAAAVFLAGDESEWITGIALPVDGGYTAV